MAENNETFARDNFKACCAYLTKTDWKYDPDEEKLVIHTGARGDDLPMDLILDFDVDRNILMVLSRLPFRFSEEKRMEGAVACSILNDALAVGNFDYDLTDGSVCYRSTTCFEGITLTDAIFEFMIHFTCGVVDKYNDKLLMVDKGMLSIDELNKFIHN